MRSRSRTKPLIAAARERGSLPCADYVTSRTSIPPGFWIADYLQRSFGVSARRDTRRSSITVPLATGKTGELSFGKMGCPPFPSRALRHVIDCTRACGPRGQAAVPARYPANRSEPVNTRRTVASAVDVDVMVVLISHLRTPGGETAAEAPEVNDERNLGRNPTERQGGELQARRFRVGRLIALATSHHGTEQSIVRRKKLDAAITATLQLWRRSPCIVVIRSMTTVRDVGGDLWGKLHQR